MKKFFSILITLMTVLSVNAAEVVNARFNKGAIEVDVQYGGGCEEHQFDLRIERCLESYPVQCSATLLHDSKNDRCEAFISKTLIFPVEKYGLDSSYYENAIFTIHGDGDSQVTTQLK